MQRDFIETVTPQEIYLEGTLPHESQILVSDSEQHVEEEANGEDGDDCPSIILSSKMTLSLVNLDKDHKTSSDGKTPSLDKTKGKIFIKFLTIYFQDQVEINFNGDIFQGP